MKRLGQKLLEERIKRGLTLEQVSEATKIRQSFLEAIEKGEYNKLPASAYAQGFVRNYAVYLGMSAKESLALFRREFDENKVFSVLPEGLHRINEFPLRRVRVRMTILGIALAILLLIGYLTFQYRFAFLDPPLHVTSPKEQATVKGDVTVAGITDANAIVFVNDTIVTVESSGTFRKKLTLFPGKETIRVVAKNRFGRETVVERHVAVE